MGVSQSLETLECGPGELPVGRVARVSSCLVAGVVGLGDGPDSLPGLIDSIEKGSIVQFVNF